jgi:Aldehyde dehydrogenase family
MIFPGQDISAYVGPAALLNIPRNSKLYHSEPFGPLDTIVVVDHLEELISEMNVSNGCLISSIACDDMKIIERVAEELRAFKVGINTPGDWWVRSVHSKEAGREDSAPKTWLVAMPTLLTRRKAASGRPLLRGRRERSEGPLEGGSTRDTVR